MNDNRKGEMIKKSSEQRIVSWRRGKDSNEIEEKK